MFPIGLLAGRVGERSGPCREPTDRRILINGEAHTNCYSNPRLHASSLGSIVRSCVRFLDPDPDGEPTFPNPHIYMKSDRIDFFLASLKPARQALQFCRTVLLCSIALYDALTLLM